MLEGQHDQPAVFELVRLQAENVQASPVWEGDSELTVFDSPTEPFAALRPVRLGRGWRYSIAMTNRNNHLLRDLRGHSQPNSTEEK
jgi:acetoacetate decarboxylase